MADRTLLTPLELAAWLETLDDDAREYFEERAGIIEYDAKKSRAEAEALAYAETLHYLKQR